MHLLAVDVGTGSARAAVFRAANGGKASATHVRPLAARAARPHHHEQATTDVWAAVCGAVRAALADAGADVAADVAGVAFAATCSLAAVDEVSGAPVSVAEGGDGGGGLVWDVVLWRDHRAVAEAEEMNAMDGGAVEQVRRHFGGRFSPENEPPKLAHLAKSMPPSVFDATAFLDLADWLSWKCVGGDVAAAPRSSCTVACKWGWGPLGVAGWSVPFWREVGLGSLVDGDDVSRRIGRRVVAPGSHVGGLCADAATALGLGNQPVSVAAGMIDAHAGALAMLHPRGGSLLARVAPRVQNRLAMICGTSTCHIAVTEQPCFVPGVWGPFREAVLPGYWCSEGGQSATGAYIDNLLTRSAAARGLRERADAAGSSVYEVLEKLASGVDARDVHILPDVQGNRSPRADPTLREVVSGYSLAAEGAQAEAELSVLFKAAMEALALGARHIVEEMNAAGHALTVIVACGGLAKSAMFRQALADACNLPVMTPVEEDAVLCGAAILAASAAEGQSLSTSLMERMSAVSEADTVLPQEEQVQYMNKKFAVYLRMAEDFYEYRRLMQ